MTYCEDEDDATCTKEVDPSPTFRMHVDDDNGDYVKLSSSPQEEEESPSPPSRLAGVPVWYLVKLSVTCTCLAIAGFFLFKWLGPPFIQKEWLEKYPKRAAVLKAAGGGNWFHQFKAVALIRISPFPYILYNYCAVATEVQYWPYLLGSLVGMQFDIITSIYTGILIRAFASVHKENTLSSAASHVSVTLVGFSMIVGTVIFYTVYAKRQLRELRKEDQRLLG